MSLFQALREECISTDSSASDKPSVLREVARAAGKCPVLRKVGEETLYAALVAREEVGTTGFGNGIAIPHCALDAVEEFVVGVIVSRGGVNFDSLDAKPVNLLVFIIGPKSKRNEHIHLLSGISRILHSRENVHELLSAQTPAVLRENFLRHVVDSLDASQQAERSLIHVFIQNQDLFNSVLQLFSELEGCSISVFEANDASYYLNALPLFSGFLSDKQKGYHRLICAMINRSLANEIVRQISIIAGDLNTATGIMVSVQDVSFCSGSLNY